ncbi:DNA polymerase delta subunit 3-like [Diadema antillarum]|uniref:DNA polymerase delta subunit 3-like n=1 Tax=Diadema antillarum TaxID=105358 RepID=UPI003A8B47A5
MEDETTVFLNNIEEYVFDEDKVVTYKWLSQTLEVHVNSAKRLLETFIKEQAKKTRDAPSTLNVTYAVTGTQETKNGIQMTRVAIVNENGLEGVKSGMKKVLGQHIFSVQKNPLKDSNALFTTDYEITKQHITRTNRFSAIQCEAAKVRSKDELERLRDSQQPTSTSEKPKVNGFGNQSASSTSSAPAKPSAPKAKKGSLAASFAAQAERNKTKEPKKEEDGEKKKTEEKKKEKPKPKGMLAFMSQKKPNTPSTAPSLSPAGDADQTKERSTKEEEDVEVEDVKEEEEEPARSKVTTAKQTQRKSLPEKKKRISVSESESDDEGRGKKVAKKRRRIIQQEDSSDEEEEDEEEEDMDDSPIPPTPPPQAEPDQSEEEGEAPPPTADQSEEKTEQSSGKGSGKRRIRKRVLRSKITMDEEGCMVTEKVWESESTDASEDDEPPPPPKPKPKKEERDEEEEDKKGKKGKGKKTSPPSSKGKQSTLMSFFKKK